MSTFIIFSPIAKLSFRTASVLFTRLIIFYKIYCVFGIAIKRFVNVISFVRISLFKSFFISLHNSQGDIFPTHGPELSATSVLGKMHPTRWSFIILPFLKFILGISAKIFLCCLSGASETCSSSEMILMFLKTG